MQKPAGYNLVSFDTGTFGGKYLLFIIQIYALTRTTKNFSKEIFQK